MIEKICEVIDGEYVCDIDISVEEWKILLRDKKVFDDKSIAALKKWFIEPDHSCTCFDIGKKYALLAESINPPGLNRRSFHPDRCLNFVQ